MPLPLTNMLSRLIEPSGRFSIAENVSWSAGVPASHTLKGMSSSGVSSSVVWAGIGERIGGVFCCAWIGGTAAHSRRQAHSSATANKVLRALPVPMVVVPRDYERIENGATPPPA